MKNLLIYLPLSFLISMISNAQDIEFKDVLRPVYVQTVSENSQTNPLAITNRSIISQPDFNIRKALRTAKRNPSILLFKDAGSHLTLYEHTYLMVLRKAANRSDNPREFQIYLSREVPFLRNQIGQPNHLTELYHSVRKNTFNGRLEVLPSIL